MASKEFEALSIPEWKLNSGGASAKMYRVFKNAAEFEMVEAENAADAISKCGTQPVYMIKFGSLDNHGILQQDMLGKMDVPVVAAVEETAAPATM